MITTKISDPNDLKMIDKKFHPEICKSIRDIIINTCAQNGGHVAPSLGVVELTVALHYVFDSPKDKILWDVGHQSYAHKILTGRKDNFHTLRKDHGISGFPKREESPHDIFNTGHASTSISAAMGIAHALNEQKNQNKVIAVIGDASISGGLAFEAINHAGHKSGRLIIILNDNEMSISPNVGALSKFLSVHLHGKTAGRIRHFFRKNVLKLPFLGHKFHNFLEKAEQATVGFFTPGNLFEAFGCNYIGPLNGHNTEELINVFLNIKESPANGHPLLIHVLTKKGKGYVPAEENPTLFHGIGKFNKNNGKPLKNNDLTFTKAFGNEIIKIAEKNEKVVAITAAMTTGTGLEKFANKFPKRFFDVGIAEGHAVTFAAGLATQGFKPIVAIYSTFLQRSFDNIIHDVCLQNLPVTFAIDRAGIVGEDGPTHHGTFDLSYLGAIPNMTIIAPRDEIILSKAMDYASSHNGPLAIRYPRGKIPTTKAENSLFNNQGEIIFNSQDPQIIIFSVGHCASIVLKAAQKLATDSIDAIVIDPIFIKPFDFTMTHKLIKNCSRLLVVEENAEIGGFGSHVANWICKQKIQNINFKTISLPDIFIEHGTQQFLRHKYKLDKQGIIETVYKMFDIKIKKSNISQKISKEKIHPTESTTYIN